MSSTTYSPRACREEAQVAWREAEDVTITVLRARLHGLALAWKRFGKYFHAFKHGGLVANRPDLQLRDDDGRLLDPAIAVWLRRKDEPFGHGHTEGKVDVAQVVRELELRAETAFEVLDLSMTSRLGLVEHAATHEPGPPDRLMRITFPVRFDLGDHAISDRARKELEALGICFTEQRREVIDDG